MGVAPFNITPSNLLAKVLSPVSTTLCSAGLKRNASTRRHDSTELEVQTATWTLWAPHASESTGKEGSNSVGQGD